MKDKVSEFGNVRGIFVIYLVAASRGCPLGTIPNGGIQRHGFRGEVAPAGWNPFDFPYGDIINIESACYNEKKVSIVFLVKFGAVLKSYFGTDCILVSFNFCFKIYMMKLTRQD